MRPSALATLRLTTNFDHGWLLHRQRPGLSASKDTVNKVGRDAKILRDFGAEDEHRIVGPESRDGGPLDMTNVREHIWKPALRRAGLRYRTMYQTRRTFTTLMLAAGEDIGWVAKQLGHASIEMVIRRYHRFIPNLTRRDGSAASRLLADQSL